MPYLIDDASPANSETTLMSTFLDSVYFDSVASVVDACAVLLLWLLLLLSAIEVLIRVPTLFPLPSSRCSFGE